MEISEKWLFGKLVILNLFQNPVNRDPELNSGLQIRSDNYHLSEVLLHYNW